MSVLKCRLCGKDAKDVNDYVVRINPTKEPPVVWECRPSCVTDISKEEALLRAIAGDHAVEQLGGPHET